MFKKILMKVIGSQPSPRAGMLPPIPFADNVPIEAIDDSAAIGQQAYDQSRREEKQRLRSILDSQEAEGRNRLACYLATETDLSPDAAKLILAAAEREVSDAPKDTGKPTAKELNAANRNNFFEQHRAENPELWNPPPPVSVSETIARITRSYAVAQGLEVTPK
jgi:hypothetical protein